MLIWGQRCAIYRLAALSLLAAVSPPQSVGAIPPFVGDSSERAWGLLHVFPEHWGGNGVLFVARLH